ncbi:MAG TPA: hypothetical protein VF590_09635, partial [Isosphaeraceae bacterium]
MRLQAMRPGLMAAALLLGAVHAAPAETIRTLFNTGVDENGAALARGAKDPHYTVSPGPGPFVAGNWEATATSAWISASADAFPGNGTFTYTTTFDLTGSVPGTARIQGSVSADDGVTIALNGAEKFSNPLSDTNQPWTRLVGFTIDSGFVAGRNTLTFTVPNTGGPSGLHVQMTGAAEAGKPDLMIRDHPGDDGGPQEGILFYVSPDIEVSPDGLVIDQDNPVIVRIRNRGTGLLREATVDLYRTPLSTSPVYDLDLSQPSVDIHAPGVVDRWLLVGRDTLRDVAPGQRVESRFVVHPRSGERTHLCFLAVIHSPEDPFEIVRENS